MPGIPGGYGYGQYGQGPYGLPVYLRQIKPGNSSVPIGGSLIIYIVETYEDGSTSTISNSNIVWESSNNNIAYITSYGVVIANSLGSAIITGTISDGDIEVYSLVITVIPSFISHRSHLTQVLLNYFPAEDIRIREEAYTIDAQLLNLAAIGIDNKGLQIDRELKSRLLNNCPTQIDNFGLYYKIPLDYTYPLQIGQTTLVSCSATLPFISGVVTAGTFIIGEEITQNNSGSTAIFVSVSPGLIFVNSITGTPDSSSLWVGNISTAMFTPSTIPGSETVVVNPYDDTLPVPSSYILDPERSITPLGSPLLFDITGSGDSINQIWNIQNIGPYSLAIPNKLTFWAENVSGTNMLANVFIQGDEYPKPLFIDQQVGGSETLLLQNEGYSQSMLVWQDISAITIKGLPSGVRLRCWQVPCNLPGVPDTSRPYTSPTFRDTLFDRYWVISPEENLLKETYMMDNFSTLEYIQSYKMSEVLSDIAIEPDTWGIIGCSGNNLIYWDRREPMPGNLDSTAITSSPMFGLDVQYDIMSTGTTRSVILLPRDYGNSSNMIRWRYISQDPEGNLLIINPDGSTLSYSSGIGWQNNLVSPIPVKFPVTTIGTYVFTLQCFGQDGSISNANFPYPNLEISFTNTYSLSNITSNSIQSVFYDGKKQLWIWDGVSLYPIKPVYDYYILSPPDNSLYFTRKYDSVVYS